MNPAKPVSLGLLAALLLPAVASAQSSNRYEGKTLTGDWGGSRTDLFERGVAFRGDYVGEAMGVVDGGYGETGARYAQQVRVGVDLDMGKLAGWDGGAFHFTLNDRRGRSTSVDLVGNRFPIQEAYGGQYTRHSAPTRWRCPATAAGTTIRWHAGVVSSPSRSARR